MKNKTLSPARINLNQYATNPSTFCYGIADGYGFPIFVDVEHALIHMGRGWHATTTSSQVAASGGKASVLIYVNSGANVHLRTFNVETTGAPSEVFFYEAPTVVVTGTIDNMRNLLRSSNRSLPVQVYYASSVSAVGSYMTHHYVAGDRAGGDHGEEYVEWILRPDTVYLFQSTNLLNQPINIIYKAFFLDVTGFPFVV